MFFKNIKNKNKYSGQELKYLKRVLKSKNWSATIGTFNSRLEKLFSEIHGVKYAVAMNSGTATLHSSLEALGIKYGDEILTPALTVIMDTTSILQANAIPIYVDIEKDSFNIDPSKIEKSITKKTKAIIVVSLYGLPPNYNEILKIAKKYSLPVIEDNAQSMLSKYNNQLIGNFGEISSWSFENSKHISCGEGGIVTTNSEDLAIRLRKFAGHGYKNLTAEGGRIRLNQDVYQDPAYKRHDSFGFNYRLSEFNAAVALAQLERVEEIVNLRIKSAELFLDVLSQTDIFVPQKIERGVKHSYYTLGVQYFGEELKGVSWYDFRKLYVEAGGDGIYSAWSVPYLEPLIKDGIYKQRVPKLYENLNYVNGTCPNAEEVQKRIMQFKTNYRNIKLAKQKAKILDSVIKKIRGR